MEDQLPCMKGKRLLIVEDNQLNMEIFKEIIGQTEIEMEEAYDGVEALEKISASPDGYYDMILSDIRMIYMNGYRMARSIRKLDRKDVKKMPIIGMTADREICKVEDAIESGMNDQIYKPFSAKEISLFFTRYLKSD